MKLSRGTRISTVALLTVVASLSLSVSAAQGDVADPRNRTVSGAVTGTTYFDFYSHGCTLVYQRFDLSFVDDRGGVGTLNADTCASYEEINGVYTPVVEGSFQLETAKGALLTGDLRGELNAEVVPIRVVMTLTVESGTRSLAHAGGTIGFVGTWDQSSTAVVGTLAGELTR